jgi:hypothetical protein
VLKVRRLIPSEIPLVTGDVVHNARSALDHLACAAVESGGGTVTTNTAFPIWRRPRRPSPQDYKALVLGKVNGAPQPFIKLLLGLQPYEGGSQEALWAIDYLDITDKHRLLIEALASYSHVQIHPAAAGPFDENLPAAAVKAFRSISIGLVPEGQYPLNDGDVLFETSWDRVGDEKPQPAIEVALGEPTILIGKPLLPALTDLVQTTTEVIEQLRKVL